ncbi:MAG TPA: phospholipid carrier-dependent glycosyltransferase [Steroidobacteraceae bacterium]|nr:phospholipid carrier-dependent glycosyltransferase [Steroidobacteraceae bacterium]
MSVQRREGSPARSRPTWLLWLVLAALWLGSLPVRPLLDPDEGRYAEIPREMWVSGDWITPRLDGLKYFEKPPLQYWGTAALYEVFGLSEWTARLWTVGLAFLCLPAVFAWARQLYGREAGLAALAALAVTPYFALVGHLNLLDPGFTFWLSAAVLALTRGLCEPEGSSGEQRWVLAAWLTAGLAVLSKGVVVPVLAGSTLAVYMLLERDWRLLRRLHCIAGGLLFLVVSAPWFILVTLRNPEFPGFFFVHEHFARFLTNVAQRVEPWWYFLPLMAVAALPWWPALGTRSPNLDRNRDSLFKPLKLLVLFSIVTLVFFSFSGSKLAPYVLPTMPVLAAVVGVRVARRPSLLRRVLQSTSGLLLLAALGVLVYGLERNGRVPTSVGIWIGVAAIAAIAAVLATPRTSSLERVAWVAAASAVVGWQALLIAYTAVPPVRSSAAIVAASKPFVRPGTLLFSVGQYRPTLSPYLERTVQPVSFTGELEFGFAQEPARQMSEESFLESWRGSRDAIAFVDSRVLEQWRRRGLAGRIIAADAYTVVVSRL